MKKFFVLSSIYVLAFVQVASLLMFVVVVASFIEPAFVNNNIFLFISIFVSMIIFSRSVKAISDYVERRFGL